MNLLHPSLTRLVILLVCPLAMSATDRLITLHLGDNEVQPRESS
jgi:hypothetical protein